MPFYAKSQGNNQLSFAKSQRNNDKFQKVNFIFVDCQMQYFHEIFIY